jgi:hypothetical protein
MRMCSSTLPLKACKARQRKTEWLTLQSTARKSCHTRFRTFWRGIEADAVCVISFVARVAEKKRILVPHFVTDLANLEKNKPHS